MCPVPACIAKSVADDTPFLRGKKCIALLVTPFELRYYTIKCKRLSHDQLKARWPYPLGIYIFDS